MLGNEKILVLIPTDNDEKRLEQTIKSIFNQTFKNISIVIVDNCSNDRTYQEALSYIDKNVGVYQLKSKVIKDEMIPAAAKLLPYANKFLDTTTYVLILRPGDQVYEGFFEECIKLFYHNREKKIHAIVSEVDMSLCENVVHKQKSLYMENRILMHGSERFEYAIQGYRHKVLMMYSAEFLQDLCWGDRRWDETYKYGSTDWCNVAWCNTTGIYANIVYNEKRGGIVNVDYFPNSLKEILLKDYVTVITDYRNMPVMEGKEGLCEQIKVNYGKRALFYAAIALLYERFEDAKDALIISKIIWDKIEEENAYHAISIMHKFEEKITLDIMDKLFEE